VAAPAVFMDTAALLALNNPRDELHAKAVEIERQLAANRARLVTSDWVLGEFLGGASLPPTRGAAASMIHVLQRSRHALIVPATRADWQRAFELFCSRPDKEWSLVDCTSMLICHEHGIRDVFTHDRHFSQAGFGILIP